MKFEELANTFTLKTLPESEVEITGDVPAAVVGEYKDAALLEIASQLDLPGFRKGHVPPAVALKQVGEVAALEEAVELFVKDFYPELIDSKKVDAVGRPDIRITKLAPGNPIGLVIRCAIYPEVVLPKNWKTLEKDVALEPAEPATEGEIKQTINSLLKSRAVAPTKTVDESTGAPSAADAEGALPLPELTDEFAQSIGAFKTVDELKAQITKGINEEKQNRAKDARRAKIIDKLLDETKVETPRIFVESELDKIVNQMREDVARFGMTFEVYLEQVKKSEDDLRKEFREQALKRAKLQLTLNKIASDEKLEADKEAVDEEMKHALQHFPDANHTLLRIHIETVLRNEKTLQLLEGNAEPKNEIQEHNHTH